MLYWIKINDTFGFVGVSKGMSMADIDSHILDDTIKDEIGLSWEEIGILCDGNNITNELISALISKGLKEQKGAFRSNGDVHAFCFEK